jgi:hypothetical protein
VIESIADTLVGVWRAKAAGGIGRLGRLRLSFSGNDKLVLAIKVRLPPEP